MQVSTIFPRVQSTSASLRQTLMRYSSFGLESAVGSYRQVGLEFDGVVLNFEDFLRQRQIEHLDLEIGNENLRFRLPPLRSMVARGNLCDPGFPAPSSVERNSRTALRAAEILLTGRATGSRGAVRTIAGASASLSPAEVRTLVLRYAFWNSPLIVLSAIEHGQLPPAFQYEN